MLAPPRGARKDDDGAGPVTFAAGVVDVGALTPGRGVRNLDRIYRESPSLRSWWV
jgi:hypothetical protein